MPDHLDVLGLRVAAGQWFGPAQFLGAHQEVVIGPGVVESLWGSGTDPRAVIGARITVDNTTFTVRGVLAEGGRDGDGSADDVVLAPMETVRRQLPSPDGQLDRIVVAPTRPDTAQRAAAEVTTVLDTRDGPAGRAVDVD